MNIESDTLNFNELIHAATVGAQYENASETYQRSVAEAENSEQLQQVIAEQSGVDDTTAPLCVEAGADVLVAGSAVFGKDDRTAAVRRLAAL